MSKTDPIVQASKVKLVDDDYPTPKREVVAEYIDEHWNEQEGLTLSHIAEETGTSRQHVKNTLSDHFERDEPDGDQDEPVSDVIGQRDLDPEVIKLIFELVTEAYRKGYRDGEHDKRDAGLGESLDRLLSKE